MWPTKSRFLLGVLRKGRPRRFTLDQKRVRLPGLEKRKAKRFACTIDTFTETSCYYEDKHLSAERAGCLGPSGPERQEVKLVNLSLAGAKLLTKSFFSEDILVTIRIGNPSNNVPYIPSLEGKAKVIWCKSASLESGARGLDQNHVGVAFQDLGWLQRFRLKKIIKWLSKEP